MPHRWLARTLWANLAVVVLLLSAGVNTGLFFYFRWENGNRITENRSRINDIQASRLESCQQGYEGTRRLFKPFFRSKSERTPKEQRDIDKFNSRVDELKGNCKEQTRP